MSEEDAIRRTIAQYCHFCDDGRFDEWADEALRAWPVFSDAVLAKAST